MSPEPKLDAETTVEFCEECDRETHHSVAIELIQESTKDANREYSREPYRTSRCNNCGTTERIRMNRK